MSFLISVGFLLQVLSGTLPVRSTPVWLARQSKPRARRPFHRLSPFFSPALNDWSPGAVPWCSASSPTSSCELIAIWSPLKYLTCTSLSIRLRSSVLLPVSVCSLFLVSMQMVTGPLFNNSTFMSAPNSPGFHFFSQGNAQFIAGSILYRGTFMSGSPDVRGRFPWSKPSVWTGSPQDFSLHIQNGLVHYAILIVKTRRLTIFLQSQSASSCESAASMPSRSWSSLWWPIYKFRQWSRMRVTRCLTLMWFVLFLQK